MSDRRLELGIVPVAGRGIRLSALPRRRPVPKAMLPLVGTFAIEYPLETLVRLGVQRVCFVVGPEPEYDLLREFLGDGRDWAMEFSFVEQHERKGVAHALTLAKRFASGPFAVVLGDDLTTADSLASGVDLFFEQNALALEYSIAESDLQSISRSCRIDIDAQGRITEILEKPANPRPGLRGIGIYLFKPELFDYIARTEPSSRTGSVELTEAIRLMARDGRAYSLPINGVNVNLNTIADLLTACAHLANRLHDQEVAGGTNGNH